ncbi:serine/threonine-protein kinase [Calidifontibacter terrae]
MSRVGETVGPYRLDRLLGRGGMGEVYLAHDTVKGRDVALKLLPPALSQDPAYAARFRREAQIAARLQEPHIVPIHDFGTTGDQLFIDMRVVEGEDLRALLQRRGRLSYDETLRLLSQVASALDAAHGSGLVHRDVKPENVLVTPGGFAYLADFGIAHETGESHLTSTGTAIGSFKYMAPERFSEDETDGRADVYSLGCVTFECLTGSAPFPGNDLSKLMRAHVLQPPPDLPASLGLSPAVTAVLHRAMAKRPADRPSTAGDLMAQFAAAIDGHDTVIRPIPRVPAREETAAATVWDGVGQGSERSQGSHRTAIAAACLAGVLAVAAVAAYFVSSGGRTHADSAASSTSGTTVASTPAARPVGSSTPTTPAEPMRVGISDVPGSGTTATGFNGFDASVARYVAQQLGYPGVSFVRVSDDQRVSAVQDGTVDIVVATFTMTPARRSVVGFAGPYFTAHLGLLVDASSAITSVSSPDLTTVCQAPGSVDTSALTAENPLITLVSGTSVTDCVNQVRDGAVSAATIDDTILAGYLTKTGYAGTVRLVETSAGPQDYGIAVPRADHDLCVKVAGALKQMIDTGAWDSAVSANYAGDFSPTRPTLDAC